MNTKVKPLFGDIKPDKQVISFVPISPIELKQTGVSNSKILEIIKLSNTPTGILMYGEDVIKDIADKSDKMLQEVKDSDVDYVKTQITNILKSAKSFQLDRTTHNKGFIGNLISKAKELVVDIKEEMLKEYNDISTQMDRTLKEVEQTQMKIITKLDSIRELYDSNIDDYKKLDKLIIDLEEAKSFLEKNNESLKSTVNDDLLKSEEVNRNIAIINRMQRRIDFLKTHRMMTLQNAPSIAMMQENALLVIEKFTDIKTFTIPNWKKMIRQYIDNMEIKSASDLAKDVDDANNEMIKNHSIQQRNTTVQVAKQSNRMGIDISTIEEVHKNLIGALADVEEINNNGAIARKDAVNKMDEMQRLYSQIASGKSPTQIQNEAKHD